MMTFSDDDRFIFRVSSTSYLFLEPSDGAGEGVFVDLSGVDDTLGSVGIPQGGQCLLHVLSTGSARKNWRVVGFARLE